MIITGLVFLVSVFLVWVWTSAKGKEQETNKDKVPAPVWGIKPIVARYASRYGVPMGLALAVAWQENNGTMLPDGSAGEKGIYQVKEIAARDVKARGNWAEVPKDWKTKPASNSKVGLQYLALMKKQHGEWETAIKAYNQGSTGMLSTKKDEKYLAEIKQKRKFF